MQATVNARFCLSAASLLPSLSREHRDVGPVALPPKVKKRDILASAGPNFNIQDKYYNEQDSTTDQHYNDVGGMDGTHVVEELDPLARKEAILCFS